MKKVIFFISCILSFSTFATVLNQPDILVYSRLEKKWSVFLLNEFRTFMDNLAIEFNPYEYNHTGVIIYGEDTIEHYVSEDVSYLLNKVSIASGIQILNVKPELSIEGLGYSIEGIKPHIIPSEKNNGDIVLKSEITLTGIKTYATQIKLSFMLNQQLQGKKIPALEVRIINPRIILNEGKDITFGLDVLFEEKEKVIQLAFANGDFSLLTEMLTDDPGMIDIVYDDIVIPEISINLMGRNLTINEKKIKEVIAELKPNLKVLLMEQVRVLFEKDGAMEVLKYFNGTSFDRDYWITTDSESMFPMFLGIRDLSSPMKGVLLTELEGDFCTSDNYNLNGNECPKTRLTPAPKSTVSKNDLTYSKDAIINVLQDSDIKFLASIGEDYLNKIIVTTIDDGVWNDLYDELGIEMGDKGVLLKLDQKGENATVVLDVVYDTGKLSGVLLKQRKLRFPVILDATIRVEYYNVDMTKEDGSVANESQPHVVFTINDVKLEDDIFLYGTQKYDFPSNIQTVRKIFRNKVLKMIKKELFDYDAPIDSERYTKWKGVDLPPFLLPEVNDMHLEKMKIQADAHGRLNLILKGTDTIYRSQN